MEITDQKKKDLLEILKCSLCHELLYQPVTLFCQDTFCKACLVKLPTNECPTCRRKFFRPPISNFKLLGLIEKVFPEEIQKRKEFVDELPSPSEEELLKEQIIKSSWRDVINKKKTTGNVQLNTDIFFLPINTNTMANQYLAT